MNITHNTFRPEIVDKASAELRALPLAGAYPCIVADPPWHHQSFSIKGQRRSPSAYYRTMSIAEISALPVAELAAKNAHLFLWTTQPHLQQSFAVLAAWGFRYSSVHTHWIKVNPKAADQMFLRERDLSIGMGFTTRKNIEYLVLGRRGSPRRLVKDMPDFLFAARRQHSRKPEESFARVERYCAGPRLELFSRTPREGWETWGDEDEKFANRPVLLGEELQGPPAPQPFAPIFEAAE